VNHKGDLRNLNVFGASSLNSLCFFLQSYCKSCVRMKEARCMIVDAEHVEDKDRKE
jgi:hypothetical protein